MAALRGVARGAVAAPRRPALAKALRRALYTAQQLPKAELASVHRHTRMDTK